MAPAFFSSLRSKDIVDENLTLFIDIGSASVAVALIKLEKGGRPHIVGSVRQNIAFQDMLTSQRIHFSMIHALDAGIKSLEEKIKNLPLVSNVFCTLSSPWFILKTRNLSISKSQEFQVTEETLDSFINEDIEKMKHEIMNVLPLEDVMIIEKNIIHIKLNGYEIKNPYKQKTSRMELITTLGISSRKVIKSIEQRIARFSKNKKIHFGGFPIAAFSTIRDMYPHDTSFILLDITGETTDVCRIENDVLVVATSFTRGKNFLIRAISTSFGTVHEEAITIFNMYLRGDLDTARMNRVEKIITQAGTEWLKKFESCIATLTKGSALPRKIFYTADDEVATLFASLLGKSKPELLVGGVFDVQYLDQLIVSNFATFNDGVNRDPFIVIEALFAQKIIAQEIKI